MRAFITVARVLVGVLFIVSGLIKANDPLGLSYKMQEFFEVWNSDLAASGFFLKNSLITFFSWLHPHTLFLSVLMITLEVLAGIALLLGWRRNGVLTLLGLLILFFTVLTAYAYGSGKFKNCGCFGDCLPISPLASLLKDVALVVLIGVLWVGRKYINPVTAAPRAGIALLLSLVLTLGVQWYVLNYLPLADCLPYKQGNNIFQQMQVPAGARPDSFAIRFVYEKGGRQFEFGAEALPADLDTYTYVDRVDRLVRKGNAEPPIKGFALTGISGTDSTAAVLSLPRVALVLAEQVQATDTAWMADLQSLVQRAGRAGVPVYLATASSLEGAATVLARHGLATVPLFALDFTAIRTAARTRPTLLYLEGGTIRGKWSARQLGQAADAW